MDKGQETRNSPWKMGGHGEDNRTKCDGGQWGLKRHRGERGCRKLCAHEGGESAKTKRA